MNESKRTAQPQDPEVQAALQEYMERVDRGEIVDGDAFLAEHAGIADELRSFIQTSEELHQIAQTRKKPEGVQASAASTHSVARQAAETTPPKDVQGQHKSSALPSPFGRYEIVRPLGSGAMGTVYLAQDTQLHREVALKTPSFDEDDSGELLERFYREARSAATLRHSNICPVFDVGEIDGQHFISMAYIEGRPLSAYIDPDKPQSEKQILLILRKLALALQEAHDHGVIHRDLKPGNIMVDGKGEPIIMDFGLACQVPKEGEARLTQSGMIVGSPAYMSPEQVQGDPGKIVPASDQYALGVILYELLTGRLPFRGGITAVIGQILTEEPKPPSELRDELDPRIEALCLKMMAKQVGDRFTSAKDVANEAARILKQPASASKRSAATTGSASADPTKPKSSSAAKESLRTSTRSPSKSAADKSVTASNVASLFEAAEKCMRKHDYDQVVQILETVPEHKRNEDATKLLAKARQRSDEVQFLVAEIDEAERTNDNETLRKKVDELLKLRPGHHKARKIKEELSRHGGGLFSRRGQRTVDGRRVGEGSWIPWAAIGIGLLVFGGALWGVTIYLRAGSAVVRVEINDPDVEVSIQGQTLTIDHDGREIKLDPKEGNVLEITYGDETFRTEDTFELIKGDNPAVRVTFLDDMLAARFGDTLLGEWPVESVPTDPASPDDPAATASATTDDDADAWIDIIPLIDPARDKFDFAWTGANNWVVRDGELSIQPDKNAAKLLFPLVLDGPSLEWEISFTRTSGKKQFTTDIPAIGGVVPISLGWGTDQVLVGPDPSQEENISLGPCIVQNRQRMLVRIRVEREKGQDRVEVFVDGESTGEWTGDRETIAKLPQEAETYRTDQQTGLYVGPSTAYTFHSIRLRMLDGEARLLDGTVVSTGTRTSTRESTPAGWTDLFNGRDLTGWDIEGAPDSWTVAGGTIVVEGSGKGFLFTEQEFDDFELALEYRLEPKGNSGIYLRAPRDVTGSEQAIEVAIIDGNAAGPHQNGALHNLQAPSEDSSNPVGEWNSMLVRADGRQLTVELNGVQVQNADLDQLLQLRPEHAGLKRTSGRIAIQHWSTERVEFRDIRIRELNHQQSAPAPEVSTGKVEDRVMQSLVLLQPEGISTQVVGVVTDEGIATVRAGSFRAVDVHSPDRQHMVAGRVASRRPFPFCWIDAEELAKLNRAVVNEAASDTLRETRDGLIAIRVGDSIEIRPGRLTPAGMLQIDFDYFPQQRGVVQVGPVFNHDGDCLGYGVRMELGADIRIFDLKRAD